MWIQGVLEDRPVRRSLKTTSWERAEEMKREMEDGVRAAKQAAPLTIEEALNRFVSECRARNLSPSTFTKYLHLKKHLLAFAQEHHYRLLRDLDSRNMRDFRNSWTLGPLTSSKQLERLRSFFRYCVDSDYIEKNPAKTIRPPVVRPRSREPFSDVDQTKLLAWCDYPTWKPAVGREHVLPPNEKTPTFLKLLVFAALRISDAATLTKDRIQDGKIFLYAAKNGRHVRVPLPPDLVSELESISGPELFRSPQASGMPKTVSDYWRNQIKKVFDYLLSELEPVDLFRSPEVDRTRNQN
jgi:integrase